MSWLPGSCLPGWWPRRRPPSRNCTLASDPAGIVRSSSGASGPAGSYSHALSCAQFTPASRQRAQLPSKPHPVASSAMSAASNRIWVSGVALPFSGGAARGLAHLTALRNAAAAHRCAPPTVQVHDQTFMDIGPPWERRVGAAEHHRGPRRLGSTACAPALPPQTLSMAFLEDLHRTWSGGRLDWAPELVRPVAAPTRHERRRPAALLPPPLPLRSPASTAAPSWDRCPCQTA